jgi:hypothetical protein
MNAQEVKLVGNTIHCLLTIVERYRLLMCWLSKAASQ